MTYRSGLRRLVKLTSTITCTGIALLLCSYARAQETLHWVWHYSAQGVSASGTLTTTSQPVQGDFYQVLSINGSRGRQPIDKLIPPGQAIPLNTDYPVDNLIDRNGQLTGNGIGFEITGGRYANVFTKITDKGSVFLEVFTMPSGAVYKEHPIHFQAHLQRTLHPANIVTP